MFIERPHRRGDLLTENLPDGTALIFDPQTERAHPLTASAAIVWEHCDGAHSVAAIVQKLSDVYDASQDIIARDVHALLNQLSESSLLEASAPVDAKAMAVSP